jgi:hypothetical protein
MRSTNVPQPMRELVWRRLGQLSQLLLSDGELRKMWSAPAMPYWQPVVFSSVLVFALWLCLQGRTTRIGALTFLFLLSCMLFSRLNIFDHHLIALIPIAAALVVAAGQDAMRRWAAAPYLAGAIATAYLGCAIYWNVTAARQIRATGGVGMWSNAIDAVRAYLENNCAGKTVKVLDWGLNNSLFVLSNARIRSVELFWGATRERSGTGKLWKDEISPGDVFVLHPPELAILPEPAAGLEQALAASALPFRRTRFRQKGGAGYAETLEILPKL